MSQAFDTSDLTGNRLEQEEWSPLPIGTSIRAYRHVFGPVGLTALLILLFVSSAWLSLGSPNSPIELNQAVHVESADDLSTLLDSYNKDYKATLLRLDNNISLQAILIVLTVLLIIRRSDSLSLFGNSIPLSWLHFFIPLLAIALWLGVGFILHELIWGRIQGVQIIKALRRPHVELQKALFRDAGFIDGWFVTFIGADYSSINPSFKAGTAGVLVLLLATLVSAAHASLLAIVSIGSRRYIPGASRQRLLWYYLAPLLPLLVLLLSHFQFAYGGANRNWLQLYVAALTVPLMAILLWLSMTIDRKFDRESLQCLRRQRRHRCFGPPRQSVFDPELAVTAEPSNRTIALIGDSLSTTFHVGWPPAMFWRLWRGWRTNWFLRLPSENQNYSSILRKVSALGTITGVQHATVSASVDRGGPRSFADHLIDRWHFSHQVDEVLAGRFPDLLLIWIGHNDVDWRKQTDNCTAESFGELADAFIERYEIQLRRLLSGALAANKPGAIVVFGLINFESFFKARAEAETKRMVNRRLFPYLETDLDTLSR